MDKDEHQVEQPQCGCESSPGSANTNWRTALFVTVVVLAGAVAAHSVLTNGGKASPCGGGMCAINQGEGNGYTCSKTSACAVEEGNGNGDAATTACCPLEGNGDGEKAACCPLEGNGDGGCCPSQKQACPMEAAAGCCATEAPADPAPQPTPTATGCCPSQVPAEPAPQPAPTGCCPGY